jgi:hypothetical protein
MASMNYNLIRENIGKTVSDGSHTYDIADYYMGYECYQLWCRDRQAFYLVGVNSLQLFTFV